VNSLGLAIPNYERVDNVVRLVELHLEKGVVDDIVICDDGSSSRTIESLKSRLPLSDDRVRLIENRENLGAFRNKARTVAQCRSPWVVLCDSDNWIDEAYIDRLRRVHDEASWSTDTIYCPIHARPAFDFTEMRPSIVEDIGSVFLNTGNYMVPRDAYVRVARAAPLFGLDPRRCFAADVIFFNILWVACGNRLQCIEGLTYGHNNENQDSFWRRSRRRSKRFIRDLRNRIDDAARLGESIPTCD
jgi:glycosyltransferase involved in cell wall biosynthesis